MSLCSLSHVTLYLAGFDQLVAVESGCVKSFQQLVQLDEDPVVHCCVSYILLGLDNLASM